MADNISQFFFAWCDASETTFGEEHQREDELIFSFKLEQDEGQFATLELEIRNPHVGLLAPGRPLWAWFAWSDGTTVTPLFHGRLVGTPSNLFAEIITINFIAKPIDYVSQRQALATSLKVLPYFDPIFIDPKQLDDPDIVLEGYSRLYHVDRATGLVTTSDLIVGEDGVEEFTPSDVFYENVGLEIGEAPLVAVEMAASAKWLQTGGGTIDIGDRALSTYGSGLNSDWPKIGQELQGGYVVVDSYAREYKPGSRQVNFSYSWQNEATQHSNGETMSVNVSLSGDLTGKPYGYQISLQPADPYSGSGASLNMSYSMIGAKKYDYATRLKLGMSMEQARTENIKFRVTADLQPVLIDLDEESIVETITLDAPDVVLAEAADTTAGGYFATDRGLQSLEYLLMVARARLLAKARVISVTWDCRFSRMLTMSCRKNASIEDSRLPGGIVIGKVVTYSMDGTGDTGEFLGHVTINSTIGQGNAIELQDGTADYVDPGYVDDYQHYSGRLVAATTGDIAFSPPAYPGTGLQNPLTPGQVLVRVEWNDAFTEQAAEEAVKQAIRSTIHSAEQSELSVTFDPPTFVDHAVKEQQDMHGIIDQAVKDNPSWLEIELKPLTGVEAVSEYVVDIAALVVPQQIDLSAATTG